jgi:adenylylsulfate kinase
MTIETASNIVWHHQQVTSGNREVLNGHKGCVIWFTGLSASGKSTISNLVEYKLYRRGLHTYLLDGDNVRHGLSAGSQLLKDRHGEEFSLRFGLGFSRQDREENIRRIGSVAQLFCEAGVITLTAFISPYRRDRNAVRAAMKHGDFIEVFVDAPIEVCERRDPKGLYKKARAGRVEDYTGVNAPYEYPTHPELILNAGEKSADILAAEVISYIEGKGIIPKVPRKGVAEDEP